MTTRALLVALCTACNLFSGSVALAQAPKAAPVTEWGGAKTWPFTPAKDSFSKDALLDLRSLNEAVAGEHGFVRVNAEGDFVRGDGQPLRFWAVNSGVGNYVAPTQPAPESAPSLARHARFLAKRGVNMVRLHQQISPDLDKNPKAAITDINEAQRDAIWRSVAALRKEGIYTTLSPYWAGPMKFAPGWGVAGDAKQAGWGLLFFDPVLQSAYKTWLRKLLTTPNPYTGIPLAQDASLAILQLQNEDSLLFWTFNSMQGAQREALERRFGEFLAQKYGSIDKALSAWPGGGDAADKPAEGRLALLPLWQLIQARRQYPLIGDPQDLRGGKAARLADETEFLTRTMQRFNQSVVEFLRNELGVKQLINPGNWKTASNTLLNDAERWSYTPGEVDAANVYTGGIHKGQYEGWAIVNGDQFTNESALLNPRLLPTNLKHTRGRPMLVTEGAWVLPNAYSAEGPFLVAAYSALTGLDGYYWFATGDDGWTPPKSANGYLPSLGKWSFGTPEMLGSFPAAALAYRLGYIARGTPVVQEQRTLQDMWARKMPLIAEGATFDPNRDAGDAAKASNVQTSVSPDAFLVGPVQVEFAAKGVASTVATLGPWVAPERVQSNTGELMLNSTQGYSTINAPKVQGVAAFFGRAPVHQLQDARFESHNAYGAAMAISLDGAPLKTSQRILLQFATQSRPTGWQEVPSPILLDDGKTVQGFTVQSYGRAPWQVVKAQLQVTIQNTKISKATVLDMNGMAVRSLPLDKTGAGLILRFPEYAMYVVLQ